MRTVWIGAAIGILGVLIGLAVALSRAGSAATAELRQDSPDALVQSAFDAIASDSPGRIADLIHADSNEMRSAMRELGELIDALAQVSRTVESRFPREVEQLRAEAAKNPSNLMRTVMGARTNADAPGPGLVQRALADPLGWLERARGRVEARSMGENVAGLYVDGAPLGGVPLTLKRENDQWWVVLPLKLPVVSRYAPQSPDEWMIVGSLAKSIRNAVIDLNTDIAKGAGEDLDDVAELAGEKAVAPLAMCFFAYQRALQLRED